MKNDSSFRRKPESTLHRFVTTAVLVLLTAPALACDLKIESAWIRTAPPTATTLAGYAKFTNSSAKPLRITNMQSPDFSKVEAHETRNENGVSKMRALDPLEVPAAGSVEFQPGGKHLMLLQPKHGFKAGDVANIAFQDVTGCVTSAAFKLSSAPATSDAMDHSRMDHSKMDYSKMDRSVH